MNILKKDEKFFSKNMSHTTLTQYYKTKDNSLRIAIFENNEFVAFETIKADGLFKQTVLDNNNSYVLKEHKQVLKTDGTVDVTIYFGEIKSDINEK